MNQWAARLLLERLGLSPTAINRLQTNLEFSFSYDRPDGPLAIIQLLPGLLRTGIMVINEKGKGVKLMRDFESQTQELARILGYNQCEVCGIGILNEKLRRILLKMDFQVTYEQLPCDIGNETEEFLIQRYEVH